MSCRGCAAGYGTRRPPAARGRERPGRPGSRPRGGPAAGLHGGGHRGGGPPVPARGAVPGLTGRRVAAGGLGGAQPYGLPTARAVRGDGGHVLDGGHALPGDHPGGLTVPHLGGLPRGTSAARTPAATAGLGGGGGRRGGVGGGLTLRRRRGRAAGIAGATGSRAALGAAAPAAPARAVARRGRVRGPAGGLRPGRGRGRLVARAVRGQPEAGPWIRYRFGVARTCRARRRPLDGGLLRNALRAHAGRSIRSGASHAGHVAGRPRQAGRRQCRKSCSSGGTSVVCGAYAYESSSRTANPASATTWRNSSRR